MERIQIIVNPDLKKRFRMKSLEDGATMTEKIISFIRDYVYADDAVTTNPMCAQGYIAGSGGESKKEEKNETWNDGA